MTDAAESLENVIDGFKEGDREAFRIIYEETKDFVFRIIYRMLHNKEETEDLMHDVYLKLFENNGRYQKDKASLKTWLYRLALNHTLNYIKRKKWFHGRLFEFVRHEETEDHAERLNEQEDIAAINKVLAKVKEMYRICIILKDIEDKSYEEIAQLLNIKVTTVKTRLNRGRKQLLKLYKEGAN